MGRGGLDWQAEGQTGPGQVEQPPASLAEWTQRDLERLDYLRFCRQYLVFHDGDSVVFAGPAGNSVETRGE